MSDPNAVTYVNGWDLPIANEGGPLSLMELSDGTCALILSSISHANSGVVISQKLASMLKDELFISKPSLVEENSQ